jgi:hypothetical protein
MHVCAQLFALEWAFEYGIGHGWVGCRVVFLKNRPKFAKNTLEPGRGALFVNWHFRDEAMLAFMYLLLQLPFGHGVCSAR